MAIHSKVAIIDQASELIDSFHSFRSYLVNLQSLNFILKNEKTIIMGIIADSD